MQVIPIQAVPSQQVEAVLGSQVCQLGLYQKRTGLFMDVYVSEALIVGGVLCQNLNRIVRDLYLGFSGDLMFLDNQGSSDPDYTGLGARYTLIYLAPSDLPAGQG